MTEPTLTAATPIDGGYCVKTVHDGTYCIDVIRMLFNYRVLLTRCDPDLNPHTLSEHGYCYFGHGVDDNGDPRTMNSAFLAAMAAATAWDGHDEPAGYDRKAF